MKNIFNYIIPAVLLTPVVASAAFAGPVAGAEFGGLSRFFSDAGGFINDILIPILLAVAFLVFIWGVMQYFLLNPDGDNSDNKKNGRNLMIWGIIAFVVIVSIWGIVALLSQGLGFDGQDLNNIPDTPTY